MNLTPEEREVGRENYYEAVSHSRRDFLRSVIAAGAVSGAGLGAMYFGYQTVKDPVRVGVIGTGDEGSVLIGAVNPDYVQVTAIADIRPFNIHRAFHGDWASDAAHYARPGLMSKYGWKTHSEAEKQVTVYDGKNGGYQELLKDKSIEAVIIALPLHLHASVAIDAMKAGKHVLTEKLMAHNIAQCKLMARVADQQGVYLATGHQRHYSVLYDNAVNMIRWGLLGELHHIRAQWHRGNLPGKDSWQMPLPGGENGIDRIAKELDRFRKSQKNEKDAATARLLEMKVAQWEAWNNDTSINPEEFGYVASSSASGPRSAMEELCRWRLFERTGGGLMAELGSHQLDAASIFISALRKDHKKAKPLSVHGVGGRHIFPNNRDAEDHVYCMFEFPAPGYDPGFDVGYEDLVAQYPDPKTGVPGYEQDPNKRIVVTYSSINGNGFGGYGEVVMGTKGTLVLETEQEVMLYRNADTSTRISVKDDKGGPTMDTQASGAMPGAVAKSAESMGPVSRGYTEEIEHWAYCIRNPDKENQPRCRPEVAMADAIIALSSNIAINRSRRGESGYLRFEDAWFDVNSDELPSDVDKNGDPLVSIESERQRLKV